MAKCSRCSWDYDREPHYDPVVDRAHVKNMCIQCYMASIRDKHKNQSVGLLGAFLKDNKANATG